MKRRRSPEFHQAGLGIEKREHVGAERLDLGEVAAQIERRVHLAVLPENREYRQRGSNPGSGDFRERLPIANEPGDPQNDQHRKEEQKVAVRERLEQPRRAKHREPSAIAAAQVLVEREQADRHPECHQGLQMRGLRDAIGIEAEDEARNHAGVVARGERQNERVSGERAQRK